MFLSVEHVPFRTAISQEERPLPTQRRHSRDCVNPDPLVPNQKVADKERPLPTRRRHSRRATVVDILRQRYAVIRYGR